MAILLLIIDLWLHFQKKNMGFQLWPFFWGGEGVELGDKQKNNWIKFHAMQAIYFFLNQNNVCEFLIRPAWGEKIILCKKRDGSDPLSNINWLQAEMVGLNV